MIGLFLQWYFVDVPKEILNAQKNFLKFGLHYFSIPFLLKTFFYHWHKYFWQYPRGLDIPKIVEVFLSNMISRVIGMITRSFLILVGIIYEVFVLFFGFLIFILWFLLPIILFFIFIYGINILLSV
jgi:hypothetical protein